MKKKILTLALMVSTFAAFAPSKTECMELSAEASSAWATFSGISAASFAFCSYKFYKSTPGSYARKFWGTSATLSLTSASFACWVYNTFTSSYSYNRTSTSSFISEGGLGIDVTVYPRHCILPAPGQPIPEGC